METERKRPGNPLYPSEARQIFEVFQTINCWVTEDSNGRRVIRLERWPLVGVRPLEDEDFFLSFARLGARGDPSDYQIKKWVAKYALPKEGDANPGHVRDRVARAGRSLADGNAQVARAGRAAHRRRQSPWVADRMSTPGIAAMSSIACATTVAWRPRIATSAW